MQILRSVDYKRMPWKNGKGETVEIAVFPPGADVSDFDWRISMATVAEDGAFSVFDGIDRTLSVLTGDGMQLSVEGRAAVLLKPSSEPHAFPGDARTTAALTRGMISDLNVMTRRGRFTHRVTRILAIGETTLAAQGELTIAIAANEVRLDADLLKPLDAMLLEKQDRPVAVHLDRETAIFLIEISSE
jgi:environmental stress-induced protein Ves